jgi:hypothetical protein
MSKLLNSVLLVSVCFMLCCTKKDAKQLKIEELEQKIKASPFYQNDNGVTVKKSDGFTFVNFNFIVGD